MKLAVVLGATRGQGASVVNALLETGQYSIRGITPDDTTPEARRLRDRGVEVVGVDLSAADQVAAALAPANAVFAVTTMYEGDTEREVRQGKHIADAAAVAKNLEHLVWSTLPSAFTVSRGRISVPHMDGKARVDEYIIGHLPILARKTTFYWGGLYAENVTYPAYAPSRLTSSGRHVWVQPVAATTIVPMVGDHSVNTGLFVRRILEKQRLCSPARYVIGVVDWMAHGDLLSTWATLLGQKEGKELDPVYVKSDVDTVSQLWPSSGKELGQMLEFSEAFGKGAWSKEDIKVLTWEDLDLKVGTGKSDLMSTADALSKLVSKL